MLFKKKPKKEKPIAVRVDIRDGDAYLFYKVLIIDLDIKPAQIANKRLKNAKEPEHLCPGFLLRVDI